jgi:hypothetical protein
MKLKKLLNENLWNERKFGEPLPTLEDTSKAYKLKQEEEVKLNERGLNPRQLQLINKIRGDRQRKLFKSINEFFKFLKNSGVKDNITSKFKKRIEKEMGELERS